MATLPVSIKPSEPAPASTPDIWRSLRAEVDRLFDRFTSRFGMAPLWSTDFGTSLGIPSPAVDIAEKEAAFIVSAEVPGMDEKDVEVSLSGDMLTIKGGKRQVREEKKRDALPVGTKLR